MHVHVFSCILVYFHVFSCMFMHVHEFSCTVFSCIFMDSHVFSCVELLEYKKQSISVKYSSRGVFRQS